MARRKISYYTPSQITGLTLWLKADSLVLNDGDTITTWSDSSGNGYDAAGSGTINPVYKTNILNGKPIVRFSGSNGFQLASNPAAAESAFDLTTYTIFAVALRTAGTTVISKNTTVTGGAGRRKLQLSISSSFAFNSGADGTGISTTATVSSFNIYCIVARGDSDHDLILNGTTTNSTTTLGDSTLNDARVEIGQAFSNGAERLTGDIAEIIVYNSALSSEQSIGVANYLSSKYNITGTNLGGYPRGAVSNRHLIGGTALSFVATNKVQVKSSAILSGSTNATISAWIKPSSLAQPSSGGTIYCERNASAGNDIFKFGFSGTGFTNQLRFQYRDDAGTLNAVIATIISISDIIFWHHVAIVKAGTGITIYIDGNVAGTGTLTANNTQTNVVVCLIGNDAKDANSSFLGLIDEVQLNNTNLSATQINNIYRGGGAQPSCLGLWRFNEGSGTVVADSTGTQTAGTITSATYTTDVPFKSRTILTM